MSGKGCKKSGRAHTPIVSKKQQGLFGAKLARKRAGKSTKTGISEADLVSHLKDSAGKKLPKKAKKKKQRGITSFFSAKEKG